MSKSSQQMIDECPHCGGPGKMKTIPGKFLRGWVGCPICKIYKQWTHDPSGAIKTWNQRRQ